MNKDEGLRESAELPQIRFPVKGIKNAADLAAEQVDIERLRKVVAEAFGAIAKATGLSEKEVLHVIEDIHVEMLEDVLKEGVNVDALKKGVQEAIKQISLATALDTQQITDVFSAKKNTNLIDIVRRLHDRSQATRDTSGN